MTVTVLFVAFIICFAAEAYLLRGVWLYDAVAGARMPENGRGEAPEYLGKGDALTRDTGDSQEVES